MTGFGDQLRRSGLVAVMMSLDLDALHEDKSRSLVHAHEYRVCCLRLSQDRVH